MHHLVELIFQGLQLGVAWVVFQGGGNNFELEEDGLAAIMPMVLIGGTYLLLILLPLFF